MWGNKKMRTPGPLPELPTIQAMPTPAPKQEEEDETEYNEKIANYDNQIQKLQQQIDKLSNKSEEVRQELVKPVIKERVQIVRELPTSPIRDFKDEDGTIVHLLTI
jgi:predicted RNase H-like nuclease (RuvC/YqgF family)